MLFYRLVTLIVWCLGVNTSQHNLQQIAPNPIPLGFSQEVTQNKDWLTFEQMLKRLHQAGIYIHTEQLAEFLLSHGLPVHLRYVPSRLQHKATQINQNYQGDMAQLIEEWDSPY
jgi:hypothetical protein